MEPFHIKATTNGEIDMEMNSKIFKQMSAMEKCEYEISYAFSTERNDINKELLAYSRAMDLLFSGKPVWTERWLSVVAEMGITDEDHMLSMMKQLKAKEAQNFLEARQIGLKSVSTFISQNNFISRHS